MPLHDDLQASRPDDRARRAWDPADDRYRRLVEMAREGIWEIDAEARTVYVNPAMAGMLECTPAEMIGRHLFDFMDERGREIAQVNLDRRKTGIDEQHDFEFVTKRNRRVIVTIETTPLHDETGAYAGALAGVIDVTERRRFEQEMVHRQKLESLGVLAGGIAHDFNNLLQSIIGNADLALLDLVSPGAPRESVLEIQHAARRATDLCRQMLAYAGKTAFQVGEVDVGSLVREMDEILKATLSKKAVFDLQVAPGLPPVAADSSQLSQIIMNLLTNASEALQGGEGVVRVTVEAEELWDGDPGHRFPLGAPPAGPYIVLTVRDNGCGMDEGTARSIFDPFFTTKFAGRGLGLASVLGIVRGHGGAIAVDTAPGCGTSITVALPAATGGLAADPALPRAAAFRMPLPMTVLVAEDEECVQQIFKRQLAGLGQHVYLVANGKEAVEFYRVHGGRVDIVMLDMMMPVMDGAEALRQIRAMDRDVPVVICSGFPSEGLAPDFGVDLPDFFLQKPFSFSQLRNILADCAECLSRGNAAAAGEPPRPDPDAGP